MSKHECSLGAQIPELKQIAHEIFETEVYCTRRGAELNPEVESEIESEDESEDESEVESEVESDVQFD